MNKKQLTAQVAKQTGVSQDEANKVVSAALDVIMEALRKNEKVTLTGFGTFQIQQKREGSKTGKKTHIAATARPVFTPGAKLKSRSISRTDIMEKRWDESFAASQDVVARLGAEALAEHHAGRTRPLEPEVL